MCRQGILLLPFVACSQLAPFLNMGYLWILLSLYGGAERVRTDDLLNANQPLFQLSYGPFTLQRVTQSPAPTPYRLPSLSMNSRSSKITKYDRTYLHPHSHTLTLVSVRTSP